MTTREIVIITIFTATPIIVYFAFGMSGKYEYCYKGWFFAPARWLRQFLCGMFLGHEYENNKCIHCLKVRRNKE